VSSNRAKMPKSQRAKQFAPFDAVVGLRQALKEKEKIRVARKTVSDDMAEEINRTLLNLKTGDIVTAVYYNEPEQEYIQLTGKVALIDSTHRIIKVENTEINIDDIYNLV